jgi:cell division septation protein DedD
MRKAWSAIAVMVPTLTLGGCVLPPAVAIASYSADIVSYEATGKTVTDHAYSAVARSDCSFIRILHAKPICVDEPDKSESVQVGRSDSAAPDAKPEAEPNSRDAYVTIGSFRQTANAERSVTRYAAFRPAVVPVVVRGEHFQRVVAGPLSRAEAAALKQKIVAATDGTHRARG